MRRITFYRTQSGRIPVKASGGDIFRILAFFDGDDLIILNHGFQKKTQKTPRQDIELAERRKADYLRRKSYE